MFGSKDNKSSSSPTSTVPAQSQSTSARQSPRSHIAEGMSVHGDINGDFDLLLDGRLEGNLRCRAVTIGQTGTVVGRIIAQEAVIDGTVEGDIEAKSVKLNVSARMAGDVRHEVIEVAAGARIEGHYSRMDGPALPKPTVTPSKPVVEDPPKTPKAGLKKNGSGAGPEPMGPEAVTVDEGAKAG